MFFGMTPTVGLQITFLGLLFTVFATLNRWAGGKLDSVQFNLPIAVGMTWISNPLDMPFLYFAFYAVGALVLPGYKLMGFGDFVQLLEPMFKVEGMLGSLDHLGEYFDNFWEVLKDIGAKVLVPMCVGSLIIAFPMSGLTYFGISVMMSRRQNAKA